MIRKLFGSILIPFLIAKLDDYENKLINFLMILKKA